MSKICYKWILRLQNTCGEPAKYYFYVYRDQVDIIQFNLISENGFTYDGTVLKTFKGKKLVRRTMAMRLSTFKRLNMFIDDVVVNQLLPKP